MASEVEPSFVFDAEKTKGGSTPLRYRRHDILLGMTLVLVAALPPAAARASAPNVVEHLLHFLTDFAIAGKHHVRELAGGMHIALRHGTHGGGKLFEDAFSGSSALAGVALDAARQADLFAQIDKDLGLLHRANLFPVEREQPLDHDKLARRKSFRLAGARVGFKI